METSFQMQSEDTETSTGHIFTCKFIVNMFSIVTHGVILTYLMFQPDRKSVV